MLTWTTQDAGSTTAVTTTTTVSYRYLQVGTEYQLIRVKCVSLGGAAPTCSSGVVLHNLDKPPDGQTWIPGTTVPSWVIQVSQPLDPADPGTTGTTIPADPTRPRMPNVSLSQSTVEVTPPAPEAARTRST